MTAFNERLKELRNTNKIIQKDIADYLGISVRAYQHYETGTRYPDFSGIQKLADFFQCSTDYLLGRTDIKEICTNRKNDLPE